MITVYSTNGCPNCLKAKNWLDKNKFKYEVIDLSKDPSKGQAMIEGTGMMTVPSINVNGKWLVGFNENELREAIK